MLDYFRVGGQKAPLVLLQSALLGEPESSVLSGASSCPQGEERPLPSEGYVLGHLPLKDALIMGAPSRILPEDPGWISYAAGREEFDV